MGRIGWDRFWAEETQNNAEVWEHFSIGGIRCRDWKSGGPKSETGDCLLGLCIPAIVWNIITFDSHGRTIGVEDSF